MAAALRKRNAAIASRDTLWSGQYSVAVQPVVMPRFFIHVTLGQNGLVSSTSVKSAQGAATADDDAARSHEAVATAANDAMRMGVLLSGSGFVGVARFAARRA